MMAEGRRRLAQGESMMVPRYDIVPIQPGLRNQLAPGSITEFPYEVVESMFNFRANEVVGQIAPRPLLLVHPSSDTVTPGARFPTSTLLSPTTRSVDGPVAPSPTDSRTPARVTSPEIVPPVKSNEPPD